MSIKARLDKLELAIVKKSHQIARVVYFIVKPGPNEVIGYRCNDRQILRLPGETLEALQKRCSDTIVPGDDFYLTFLPIYNDQKGFG
ncbi:MAG: hypothetical protein ACXW1Z_14830 [Methylobacter sp.]